MRIDFEALADALHAETLVPQWLPDGSRVGSEWVARNPTRADNRPGSFSINLRSGAWADFATGDEGGDLISLWAYLRHNNDNAAAARELAETHGVGLQAPAAAPSNVRRIDDRADRPRLVFPVPAEAPRPDFRHPTHGTPSKVWPYYDRDGRVLMYVCRFDPAGERKQICPLSWCDHPGKPSRWTWRGVTGTDKRPLYGQDRLAALPDADVLVVEGEKTADAAQSIVGRDFAVVAWLGGTACSDRINLRPLAGRRVWLWPDFDLQREKLTNDERAAGVDPASKPLMPYHEQPGPAAMIDIARGLAQLGTAAMLVGYDPAAPRFPAGWDLADAQGWGVQNVRQFLELHAGDWREIAGGKPPETPPAPAEDPVDLVETPAGAAANDNAPQARPLDVDLNPFGFPHMTDKGAPQNTVENVAHLLREYGIGCRYNVISKEVEIDIPGRSFTQDNRAANALATIGSLCSRNRVPKSDLAEYLTLIADANLRNPAADWILSREWDGVDRLPALVKTLDPVDPELAELLLRRWMIGAVACALAPRGFAMQGVIVLQGPQGSGKTTWIWQLAGGRDLGLMLEGAQLNPADKDSVKLAISHWLVELGELDATFRRADIASLKAFLTRDRDELRLPYMRASSQFPRRTAFAASVNEREFLRDETGNRRYWAIEHGPGLQALHDIDVQQVWAQAAAAWRAGERHALSREEMDRLNGSNEAFTEISPIEQLMRARFDWESLHRVGPMTATEVLLAIGYDRPNKQQTREAGVILRKLTLGDPRKLHGNMVYDMPPRIQTEQDPRDRMY